MGFRNLFRVRWLICFLVAAMVLILVHSKTGMYHYWMSVSQEWEAREHFLNLIPARITTLPVTDEEACRCNRLGLPQGSLPDHVVSSCDGYATARGPHQNVSSFSLYGDATSMYFQGIVQNAEEIRRLYPGWVMRVYHSVDTSRPEQLRALCQLWCNFTHLDFCQVGRLPPPLGDQSSINGMLWRFFVLGDPLVERFIVRDLDSLPSQREAAAVHDWIQSNRTWHFMRDNEGHNVSILGGLWGGRNSDLKMTRMLRQRLIKEGATYYKGADQDMLERLLYPVALRTMDFVNHDSYFCMTYVNTRPWPVKRNADLGFVGDAVMHKKNAVQQKCPVQCRPEQHKDWEYC